MQTGALEEKAVKLLEPGDMFGDYTVERLLGKGGMGAVYLVRAPGGERYAVKVMSPEVVEKGSDYRKRFAREAEFAMNIRHKNLISVYDVGEDPETGLCYIIMDYVPGGSVADRLEQDGPLPMAEAVSIAAQVALALEVAHRHGVIHRDIKPENIMFDADGTPKLADLGVAKFTDGAHKTTVTTTGMIIGTPAYMAPEQMMDSHHIDARADIYALGVVLYEMLTGTRPNEGSTAVELLAKAIKGEPLPDVRTMRPEISAAIAHVLSLMCAPKPEGRPATALAAAHLLQKAVTGRLVLPKKPPRAADAETRKKKRNVPWAFLAVCVIVGAICVTVIAKLLNKPASQVVRQSVVMTNVIERTSVVTNVVQRASVATNVVERPVPSTNSPAPVSKVELPAPSGGSGNESAETESSQDTFLFKPPAPKFQMGVREDALKWLESGTRLAEGTAVRVCHDLSHGGFPGTNQVFYAKFLEKERDFEFKPCWHDLTSENLDAVNTLVIPSSPAQILYDAGERAAIDRFLAKGGTVVVFAEANEDNLWAVNKFFSPYGLAVFVMEEYLGKDKSAHNLASPARSTCSVAKDVQLELKLRTFAAPSDEDGSAEWSAVVTAGREKRAVVATRRVGKGHLVFASSGWYWYEASNRFTPVTSSGNELLWKSIFFSAARNLPIRATTPIGERPVTDSPVILSAGPVKIYAAKRWRDHAYKLRDIVRQAVPILERYCGRVLDPAEMEHTKYVLTGTSIWGYVNAGPNTIVTSATFRGFPDKIGYLSEFIFSQMVSGITGGNKISLSGYIANRALADMGFPGELASRINEGKKLDPSFLKYRLSNGVVVRDENGRLIQKGYSEIIRAKNFSALEDIRSRHPDFVPAFIARKKNVSGQLTSSQSIGILTEVTGEDCFKVFEKYGVVCSRKDAVIPQERLIKPTQGRPSPDARATGALEIFPCADPKSTKWKTRSPWRYETRDPAPIGGKKWMEPEFRDSGWKRTNKPLGSCSSKALMRIADRWPSISQRLYLRRRFNWNGARAVKVELMLFHACSVTFYLNGTRILDMAGRNDDWERVDVPIDEFAKALRDGENVLAVEVWDNTGTRYFDCGLTVEKEAVK